MNAQPPIRPKVLLVDDHRAVRQALVQLLEQNGMTVCAQASTCEEALAHVSGKKIDLALVDLSLGGDALALVAELYRLDIAVVVCSNHEGPACVRQALSRGARAYVAKRDAGRVLVRALWDVLEGWVLVSPHAADNLPGG